MKIVEKILLLLRGASTSYQKGYWAEALAAFSLRLKGYKILQRRYKNSFGEIDIIARRRNLLIFVEVKFRPNLMQGLDAIQVKQRRRIERASQIYLQSSKVKSESLRFDAIVVSKGRWPQHYPNAWRMGD